MSDDPQTQAVVLPTLDKSKLYTLARSVPLLKLLVPDVDIQMNTEVDINQNFPRDESDGDQTRILINYTNARGSASLNKLTDSERLTRQFDIDNFMNGFVGKLNEDESADSSEEAINKALLTALNMAVVTTLGLNAGGDVSNKVKALSTVVLQAITAIVFDDVLDLLIVVNELPLKEGQTQTDSVIVAMWPVHYRQNAEMAEALTLVDAESEDKPTLQ